MILDLNSQKLFQIYFLDIMSSNLTFFIFMRFAAKQLNVTKVLVHSITYNKYKFYIFENQFKISSILLNYLELF